MTKREMIVAFIKDMLRPKTIKEIIDVEMREAYLSKMQAEKSLQYAQSLVEYNRQRIRVLEEKLKEFAKATKVDLRKFIDNIKATETKLNGRINSDIVLLRVQ